MVVLMTKEVSSKSNFYWKNDKKNFYQLYLNNTVNFLVNEKSRSTVNWHGI